MTLSRQVLRKIDDQLRSESDEEKGEWMAKVPISGATKAVWQRYCQAAGVHMGQGVAMLIHHELASVVGEDLQTLGDRLKAIQTQLDNRALALANAEEALERRQRDVEVREAKVRERERALKARETEIAVSDRRRVQSPSTPTQAASRKLGRNEPCWCKSGKKFKYCHGAA